MKTFKLDFRVCKLVCKVVPGYAVASLLYALVSTAFTILDLYIIEEIITLIENETTTFKEVLIFILWTTSVKVICDILMSVYRRFIRTRYRNIWVRRIQRIIYQKAMKIDISYFDDPKAYDKFSRSMKQSDIKSIDCYDSTIGLLTSLLGIISLITYISMITPILCVITAITSIIAYLCYLRINTLSFKAYKQVEVFERNESYIKRAFYLEKNACDIKTTNISKLLIEESKNVYINEDTLLRKSERKTRLWRFGEDFIYQIVANFVIYIYLMDRVFRGYITIGKFTALISAALRFISRFYNLSWNIASINQNVLYVEDFLWLYDFEPSQELDNGKEITHDFSSLELSNISFKYPNQTTFSLENINMKINKGQRVAIIGYNGAGKTTLTKLILKLYNPDNGNIYINDMNYNDVSIKGLRKQYAIVMQDFQIYCASVVENVLMRKARDEEDRQRVIYALEKADMLDYVNKLPNGIDTILTKEFSNDGIEFSGGERQKIAIARVFASAAEIVILDEPTSALDPLSEKEINDRIINNNGKTIIIISHRLSTIVNADIIYMMDSGKIIESGTHNELIKKHQKYYEMFNAQASLYHK